MKRKIEDVLDVEGGKLKVEEWEKSKKKKKKKIQESEDVSDDGQANNEANIKGDKSKKMESGDATESDAIEANMEANGDGERNKQKKQKKKRENAPDSIEEKTGTVEEGKCEKKKKNKRKKVSNTVEGNQEVGEEWEKSKKKKKKIQESEDVSDDGQADNEANMKRDKSKKKESEDATKSDVIEAKMEANGNGERNKQKKQKMKRVKAPDNIEEMAGTIEEEQKCEKKKKSKKVSSVVEDNQEVDEETGKSTKSKKKSKKRKGEDVSVDGTEEKSKKKNTKRDKTPDSIKDMTQTDEEDGKFKKKKKKTKKGKARIEDDDGIQTSRNPTSKGKSKKVRWSDPVEQCGDSPSGKNRPNESDESELIQGKRFSEEENELVKSSVLRYIETHDLGDEGLNMVLNCKKFPKVRGCWKEIAEALPWRPVSSIYYRAHILFERSEERKWTEEEKAYVLNFYKENGAQWKKLSTQLDKHRFHCKDLWRRNRLENVRKGHWLQSELQTLFDLVNLDLRIRAREQRTNKHGMIRDNICWDAISSKLSTRVDTQCCIKWYGQLTSPMVKLGLWSDIDDYRLLEALCAMDASSMDDVEWDYLLDHRDGDICRKRWLEMVKHIGDMRQMPFTEQVDVLAKRYDPDYLEDREQFDAQPILP